MDTPLSLDDFDYDLPEDLIARFPCETRSQSRLLRVAPDSGALQHAFFYELVDLLAPGDLLVANNTQVIPARLFGHKDSGGRVELLIERIVDPQHAIAYVKASKAPRVGQSLHLENAYTPTIVDRHNDQFHLHLQDSCSWWDVLHKVGHIPLPPYLQRADEAFDRDRYQTVYASQQGAVAAPTAGLHFDEPLLQRLADKGIAMEYLTLHVGAGTFQPVRVQNIKTHQMHAEYVEVSADLCAAIQRTKAQGGRVIAVGTTSVRSLESACQSGELAPFFGDTRLFIYPGFEFHCVDAMITNFHLPKSSLLMLISAFAGLDLIRTAYQAAIAEQYRFFSYGDAMLLMNDT